MINNVFITRVWKRLREKLNIGGAGLAISESFFRPRFLANFLFYAIQSRFRPQRPFYYPLTLMIEISGICNLFCDRCERSSVKNEVMGKSTSIKTIKKILPILPYAYSVYLVGGYGEAFLNPNFWRIHSLLKKTGVIVGFFTNGVLLNKKNIDKIFREQTDSVLISIDSSKKDVYEQIRKGANFEQVIRNIKRLVAEKKERKSKKPDIGLSFTFQKNTFAEMPKFLYFAKDLGVDFVSFAGMIAHKKKNIIDSPFLIEEKKIKEVFDEVEEISEQIGMPIRLPKPSIDYDRPCCPHLWRDMIVFYNGDVSPCPYFRINKEFYFFVENRHLVQTDKHVPALIVGNINNEPITKIWRNDFYQQLRKNLNKKSSRSPCDTCYFKYGVH